MPGIVRPKKSFWCYKLLIPAEKTIILWDKRKI